MYEILGDLSAVSENMTSGISNTSSDVLLEMTSIINNVNEQKLNTKVGCGELFKNIADLNPTKCFTAEKAYSFLSHVVFQQF